MKQWFKLSLISSLLITGSSIAYALNPIQGIYGGLLGEVSHGSNTTFGFDGYSGEIKLNLLGGGGAGYIGYRMQNFRLEGEILYNRIGYDALTVGSCNIQSPTVLTPVGQCPNEFYAEGLGFNGSTAAIYALFNFYYDFVTYGNEDRVVPYLGLGLGGARIKNSSNFTNTVQMTSAGSSVNTNGVAAQGILGVSYYLDDFTWAGMDYRYLSANSVNNFMQGRYTINTINFNINFSFDKN